MAHPSIGPSSAQTAAGLDAPFSICGGTEKQIVVYQAEKRCLIHLNEMDIRIGALLTLAPLEWWQTRFPGSGPGKVGVLEAANWLIRRANAVGHFGKDRVRGRGAWREGERLIFHAGERLLIDGQERRLEEFQGPFYERREPLPWPADSALTAAEGARLLKMAHSFRWAYPSSAVLLLGWCALAPLCGALDWRPHIWITGGAGTGKTTALTHFVKPLLHGALLHVQGNSTEAGIRQTLGHDALPIMMDESEQNNEREQARVQNLIAMLRQSSSETGASTLKGTSGGQAMSFLIRSMACVGSIQVGLRQQADLERFAVLELLPAPRAADGGEGRRRSLLNLMALAKGGDVPGRLRRRMIERFPQFLKSLEVFRFICLGAFGSERHADQLGTLLAGAWTVTHDFAATAAAGRRFMGRDDWRHFLPAAGTDDPQEAFSILVQARIRAGVREFSVFDLVQIVCRSPHASDEVSLKEAKRYLQNHGVKVLQGECPVMLLGRSSVGLKELFKGTRFAEDPISILKRHPDALSWKGGTHTFGGLPSRCEALPLTLLAGLDGDG